jgi:peptidoglycan/LPS O-acetylase OafA/YrhL
MDPLEPMDLTALEQAVRADLERERGAVAWLRSRSTPARLGLALGFVALVAALVLLVAGRHDLHVYPLARLVLTVGWFVVAAGACAWLALRPAYLPRPSPAVVAAVAAFALCGPVVVALLPEVHTNDLRGHAGICFGLGSMMAVLALLAGRALDRGAHGTGQLVLAAAAAGLVGNLALALHCPVNHMAHLLLGHATVPLALVLGAWIGHRRLRP